VEVTKASCKRPQQIRLSSIARCWPIRT
jgi:hypothetical protein